MQDSPQIYELLTDLREQELRRVSLHRIEAMQPRSQPTAGVRATIAGAIVRVGLLLDGDAGVRDRREARTIVAPEGDPTWHW
jgi:hypothetical protein